jgi:hypothetical protein
LKKVLPGSHIRFQLSAGEESSGLCKAGGSTETHGPDLINFRATAPYFYGAILLRAIKSKIIVVLVLHRHRGGRM